MSSSHPYCRRKLVIVILVDLVNNIPIAMIAALFHCADGIDDRIRRESGCRLPRLEESHYEYLHSVGISYSRHVVDVSVVAVVVVVSSIARGSHSSSFTFHSSYPSYSLPIMMIVVVVAAAIPSSFKGYLLC
jgi:hypothetical protein